MVLSRLIFNTVSNMPWQHADYSATSKLLFISKQAVQFLIQEVPWKVGGDDHPRADREKTA
jgi:hypothetical protein